MPTTILVAEDERDIRNLLRIPLEKNGYAVAEARDGREAWELFSSREIHQAILDAMMPVLDGFNLLRKIREISTIPVIFLTARSDDMDKAPICQKMMVQRGQTIFCPLFYAFPPFPLS